MANAKRGESEVVLGGVKRTFRLTGQACEEFKSMTGMSVLKAAASLEQDMDEGVLFRLMFVGLHAADKMLTYEAFAESVTLEDVGAFVQQLGGTIATAFGAAEGNATAGKTTG